MARDPEELTSAERRLTLGALWRYKETLGKQLTDPDGELLAEDVSHEIGVMETLDSAATKLGGDPSKHLYGAPEV